MPRNLSLFMPLLSALAGGVHAAGFVLPTIPVTWREGACDDGFMAPMEPFVRWGNGEIARRRTRLCFTYDREGLRVCVSAQEIDMATVRLAFAQGRPERIRDDDSVSLYLRTDGTVHEFTVASDGKLDEVRWQQGQEQVAWTGGATWSVVRPEEWMGYLVIPWAALGLAAEPGTRIDFAAVRRARPIHEVSGWPACDQAKEPPTQWGALVLAGPEQPYIGQFIPSKMIPGQCNLVYWLKPDGTKGAIEVLASDGGEPWPLPLTPKHEGSGGGWWTSSYHLPPGAPLKLQAIMRVNGQVLHATAVLPLPLPRLTEGIAETQARVGQLKAGAEEVPDAAARESLLAACDQWAEELRTLSTSAGEALAEPPSAARADWLTECSTQAERCAWRCGLLEGRRSALMNGAAASGFAVGTTHSVRKLRRDETDLDYGLPLRLRAARRERESGQIVVIPFDRPLQNVQIKWGDLEGPGGAAISRDDVQVDVVGYVQTTPPDYEVEYVGWWPDPLLPREPLAVPIHHTQPLWVTVHARADATAGLYRGTVTIDAGEGGTLDVPLEVEVLDYALPLRGKLRTIFGLHWSGSLVAWYGWDEPGSDGPSTYEYKNIPQEWARQIWDLTLSYRIYAGGLYEILPFPRPEDLDYCLERGLNNYQIGLAQSSDATKDPHEFLPRLREMAALAREKGIVDLCYFYGWDEYPEQKEEWYQHFLSDFTAAKREIPDISRCDVYGHPTPAVRDVLDIVVPLTPELRHRERWEPWRQQGRTLGAYVCCGPHHPYANFFIDYPAMDQRVLFWQLYDYGVEFFLYYAINQWRQSHRAGDRWPDAPWVTASHGNDNGDGHLLYPGKKAVLPSVRLANIRDGIEDYEALAVLKELTEKLNRTEHADLVAENEKMLAVPDEVTSSISQYTPDPWILLQARRRLDEQILRTKRALGP